MLWHRQHRGRGGKKVAVKRNWKLHSDAKSRSRQATIVRSLQGPPRTFPKAATALWFSLKSHSKWNCLGKFYLGVCHINMFVQRVLFKTAIYLKMGTSTRKTRQLTPVLLQPRYKAGYERDLIGQAFFVRSACIVGMNTHVLSSTNPFSRPYKLLSHPEQGFESLEACLCLPNLPVTLLKYTTSPYKSHLEHIWCITNLLSSKPGERESCYFKNVF